MDTLPVFDERSIINLLVELRRSPGDGSEQMILDELARLISGRKLLLAYRTSGGAPEHLCLNFRTIHKLRSLFIHKGDGEDFTAEYLSDVFVKSIYDIEIVEISSCTHVEKPKAVKKVSKMKTVQHPKMKTVQHSKKTSTNQDNK